MKKVVLYILTCGALFSLALILNLYTVFLIGYGAIYITPVMILFLQVIFIRIYPLFTRTNLSILKSFVDAILIFSLGLIIVVCIPFQPRFQLTGYPAIQDQIAGALMYALILSCIQSFIVLPIYRFSYKGKTGNSK